MTTGPTSNYNIPPNQSYAHEEMGSPPNNTDKIIDELLEEKISLKNLAPTDLEQLKANFLDKIRNLPDSTPHDKKMKYVNLFWQVKQFKPTPLLDHLESMAPKKATDQLDKNSQTYTDDLVKAIQDEITSAEKQLSSPPEQPTEVKQFMNGIRNAETLKVVESYLKSIKLNGIVKKLEVLTGIKTDPSKLSTLRSIDEYTEKLVCIVQIKNTYSEYTSDELFDKGLRFLQNFKKFESEKKKLQ